MTEDILVRKINQLNKLIKKVDKNKKRIEKFLGNEKKLRKLNADVLIGVEENQVSIKQLKNELNKTNKQGKKNNSSREREVEHITLVMKKALEKQKVILKLVKTNKL